MTEKTVRINATTTHIKRPTAMYNSLSRIGLISSIGVLNDLNTLVIVNLPMMYPPTKNTHNPKIANNTVVNITLRFNYSTNIQNINETTK